MTNDHELLEQLLAERADGFLNTAQLVELDRAVAADKDAARLAAQYARLRQLLSGFRSIPADVNWDDSAERLCLAVHQDQAAAGVDALLKSALPPMPDVDWNAVKRRFAGAVRQDALSGLSAKRDSRTSDSRTSKLPGAWRILAPMALAAAIGLVVWNPFSGGPVVPPVPAPRATAVLQVPQSAGKMVVRFDQKTPQGIIRPTPVPPSPPATVIATSRHEPIPADWAEIIAASLY